MKVAFIEDSCDSKDEAEIGLAKWTRNNEPVSCLFAKKVERSTGLTSPRLIGSLICCCRKRKSSGLLIIRSHRPRS
jgi:hypothetical protein